MKKNLSFLKAVLLLLFFSFNLNAYAAETYIKLPLEYLGDITKTKEVKSNTNYLERLLINQIMQNSSINGVNLKDYNVDEIIKYFNEDNLFQKNGSDELIEPITGARLKFKSDGECYDEDACKIKVDFGSKDNKENQEDLIFKIKRDKENGIRLNFPDFNN